MKIALITDTHWGIRNDSIFFHDTTKSFLDNIFFPHLKNENIKTVIHLGDLVDRRKYINFLTSNRVRKDFLLPLQLMDIDTHIIVGNHDCFYKNTNEVNALRELVAGKYNNIKIYSSTTEVEFDGLNILFIPWICEENKEETFTRIKATNAQICMGHLELAGFQMYKGIVSAEGLSPKIFSKFDSVFSGHYHHRSNDGNIFYLGSHAEFTWSDYNDPRGFHVFDTKTRKLDFIENPYRVFRKIFYKGAETVKDEIDYSKSIVKIIVQNKDNPYLFDQFVESIEKQNPIELQIVEDHLNLDVEENDSLVNEAESTIDIFKKYIDITDISKNDKNELQQVILDLYNEALTVG